MCFYGCQTFQVSLQESNTRKAVGALLSQLGQLPHKQLLLWWHAQEPQVQAGTQPEHTAAVAGWLRQCCSALQAGQLPELQPGEDPLVTLLAWLVEALPGGVEGSAQPQQQQQQQHNNQVPHQQHDSPPPPQAHPAEALRQLLDVVLSALQFKHGLSMLE